MGMMRRDEDYVYDIAKERPVLGFNVAPDNYLLYHTSPEFEQHAQSMFTTEATRNVPLPAGQWLDHTERPVMCAYGWHYHLSPMTASNNWFNEHARSTLYASFYAGPTLIELDAISARATSVEKRVAKSRMVLGRFVGGLDWLSNTDAAYSIVDMLGEEISAIEQAIMRYVALDTHSTEAHPRRQYDSRSAEVARRIEHDLFSNDENSILRLITGHASVRDAMIAIDNVAPIPEFRDEFNLWTRLDFDNKHYWNGSISEYGIPYVRRNIGFDNYVPATSIVRDLRAKASDLTLDRINVYAYLIAVCVVLDAVYRASSIDRATPEPTRTLAFVHGLVRAMPSDSGLSINLGAMRSIESAMMSVFTGYADVPFDYQTRTEPVVMQGWEFPADGLRAMLIETHATNGTKKRRHFI